MAPVGCHHNDWQQFVSQVEVEVEMQKSTLLSPVA